MFRKSSVSKFGRTGPGYGVIVVALLVLLAAALVLSLAVGARAIPLSVVFDALVHPTAGPDQAVVVDGRLPRTLTGLIAGVGLGVAGALMQAVSRNPLAEPGLFGVNAGAAFAVVCAVGLVGDLGPFGTLGAALAGAVAATVLVWVVGGSGRGSADPARLALAGVALGAVLYGIGQGLALASPRTFDRLRVWQVGTLDVRSLATAAAAAPVVLAGLIVALACARSLNVIALGEDVATTVGARVGLTRLFTVVAITLLAGGATAAVGAIGFLGLMVPHAVRPLVGRDQRRVIVACALLAPIVLLVADVVGRIVVPGELPVGVAMAFIGGPVLVAIARGRKVHAL